MRLFIRIQDGSPLGHPITEVNMLQAFPGVDLDNLPPEFAPFERVPKPRPEAGKFIVSASSRYELVDGVAKDVWTVVQEDLPVLEVPTEPPVDEPSD